ncbi:hypothetical protein GH5_01873 [Leishmania sp. Ghana 2012 LV757]|uniref:hypothetical protein n=1 Tax=Leishmania sp. Ghana 2012 LV757 TaxID=2803181 RepID=UPI001B5D3066|nr:hypothetical protein GH5_01873 [Leishmania sp. Ghana 2012 LV757]
MKSSVPTSGKVSPLRSSTFLLPPQTGPQRTVTGCASIRLDTYHDTSDLRAALRKIEAAFVSVEQKTAADATTSLSTAEEAGKATVDVRLASAGDSAPSQPTAVARKKCAATAPVLPKRGLPAILELSPQLVIHCFSFCTLQSLGVLCRVSVRMNVLVARQGTALWLAAARQRRILISVPACAQEELRDALLQRARERRAEEAYYEAEIARMEERLSARAQDIYAQNVDVDLTLRTNGGGSAPAATSPVPLWLRQQRMAQAKVCGAVDSADGAPALLSQSTEMCAKLQTEIEALEEMRRACESRLKLQEELLLQQDAQLRQWHSLLAPCKVSGSGHSLVPEAASTVTDSSHSQSESAETVASSKALISAAQIDAFERRMARLVLNGCISTSSAAIAGTPMEEPSLPVVLRRGVEDFASLELVLRALGCGEPINSFNPANHGGMFTGNNGAATTGAMAAAGASASAVRAAAARWNAFQKVCPTNEEYGKARLFFKSQALRAVPASAARVRSCAGGRCPANVDERSQQRASAKQMPALLRLSGFVRRVEAMSDAQVLQEWM